MIISICCIPCSWSQLEPTSRKHRTSWHNLSSIRLSGLMAKKTHRHRNMRVDNLSRIYIILAGNFLGKKHVYIYIYMVLKAPKEWWNLVLQNAKDSKDLYNFAHSASHIMQAKNSTKCSLSHFNWDHIRVWHWATNCTPWNWQIARENEWLEDEMSFWSFGSFALAYFQGLLGLF